MNAIRSVLVLILAALGGCSGSLLQSKIPQQTTYVLQAVSVAAPHAAAVPASDAAAASGVASGAAPMLGVDLSVLKPHLSPGLDTDRILALYPDRRLDYFAGARWAGTLDDMVQDLAVEVFRARREVRNVNGEASRFPGQYWLEIEIEDFQAEYQAPDTVPTVRVRLSARLGSVADHREFADFEAMSLQPAADNRLGLIVAAYERAANAALAQIAAQTVSSLRQYPAAKP